MPRKGMRSIFFPYSPSRSYDQLSSPSFSTARRSFVESIMVQTIERTEPVISKWDADADNTSTSKFTSLFHEDRWEAKKFMGQVSELHKAMQSLVSEDSMSELLVSAHKLMQVAMKRLQKEFHQILSTNQACLNRETVSARSSLTSVRSSLTSTRDSTSDSGDDSEDDTRVSDHQLVMEFDNASAVVMADLKWIVECMISCGYGKECVDIYVSIRKSIIDEGIYKLGIDKESSWKRIRKMDWEILDLKIKNWLNVVNVAINLFHGERLLCDQIFAATNSVRESCFNAITKEAATTLFEFPEDVMKNRRKSPEKIFRALDMYTAIASHWPEIESIFSFESTYALVNQAIKSTKKLADYVRSALIDFEALVYKNSSKSLVAGAGIHQLTTDVINFLCLLADYNVLGNILNDSPASSLPESYYSTSKSEDSPAQAVSRRFAWSILVLLSKIDRKAEHYKDSSHSYLFLANNLNYVVSKVRSSNLKYMLGENWISNHEAKIKLFAANYERIGWSHVIKAIPPIPTATTLLETVKEKVERFNGAFEEAHRKQSAVVIPDSKLRDEIKVSVARKLLPSYRQFYDTFRSEFWRERNLVGVVRFAPEDLGHALSDLFFGSGKSVNLLLSRP